MARDDDLINDALARAGFARLSPEMADLFVSIERRIARGEDVSWCEYQSILFACYASSYGDYHQARIFA